MKHLWSQAWSRWHRAAFVSCLLMLSLSSQASEVITREFSSPTLKRTWAYNVYLPSDYQASKLAYPVLYLLHGRGNDFREWLGEGHIQTTADELIAKGEIPAAIIVMPDGGNSWYVDRDELMETALLRDLPAEIETNFRALRTREGRLIGGFSMGGYGALRLVLKYPDRFAAAALLSPAIYDPVPPMGSSAREPGVFGARKFDEKLWRRLNYPRLWPAYLAKKTPVPMYINSGDDDVFAIEVEAVRLYSLIKAQHQPAELRIVDGAHAWPVWESTIGDAMKYIFRYAARPSAL